MKQPTGTRHYFVDEAGDLTLFNRSGAVIIGREGCSQAFMVGVALLPDPTEAQSRLSELRAALLADPYFKDVPSMRADAGKTALCFHAKDDVPEVRREVFRLLPSLNAQVQVAIRRKHELVGQARMARRLGATLSPNDVYDDLVKRLFRNLLHQGDHNVVVFARRGKSDRQVALEGAIAKAKQNFRRKWGGNVDSPTVVHADVPSASAGWQIVDYYLWALQRLFERCEDRYFALLANDYRLIMDLDDQRDRPYGRWYSRSDTLTRAKIKPLTS